MTARTHIPNGTRFGRLIVIGAASPINGAVRYQCLCDCGCVKPVRSHLLRKGHTRSCGCLVREHSGSPRHGMSHSMTYRSWSHMRGRCLNPRHHAYADYGGRGIRVCERWSKFENFLSDMGERPANTSLDRIDNAGDYAPHNCRWATASQQQRNKRANRTITAFGRTLTITEWAQEAGLTHHIITSRISKGWTAADAVSRPRVPREERGRRATAKRIATQRLLRVA